MPDQPTVQLTIDELAFFLPTKPALFNQWVEQTADVANSQLRWAIYCHQVLSHFASQFAEQRFDPKKWFRIYEKLAAARHVIALVLDHPKSYGMHRSSNEYWYKTRIMSVGRYSNSFQTILTLLQKASVKAIDDYYEDHGCGAPGWFRIAKHYNTLRIPMAVRQSKAYQELNISSYLDPLRFDRQERRELIITKGDFCLTRISLADNWSDNLIMRCCEQRWDDIIVGHVPPRSIFVFHSPTWVQSPIQQIITKNLQKLFAVSPSDQSLQWKYIAKIAYYLAHLCPLQSGSASVSWMFVGILMRMFQLPLRAQRGDRLGWDLLAMTTETANQYVKIFQDLWDDPSPQQRAVLTSANVRVPDFVRLNFTRWKKHWFEDPGLLALYALHGFELSAPELTACRASMLPAPNNNVTNKLIDMWENMEKLRKGILLLYCQAVEHIRAGNNEAANGLLEDIFIQLAAGIRAKHLENLPPDPKLRPWIEQIKHASYKLLIHLNIEKNDFDRAKQIGKPDEDEIIFKKEEMDFILAKATHQSNFEQFSYEYSFVIASPDAAEGVSTAACSKDERSKVDDANTHIDTKYKAPDVTHAKPPAPAGTAALADHYLLHKTTAHASSVSDASPSNKTLRQSV